MSYPPVVSTPVYVFNLSPITFIIPKNNTDIQEYFSPEAEPLQFEHKINAKTPGGGSARGFESITKGLSG